MTTILDISFVAAILKQHPDRIYIRKDGARVKLKGFRVAYVKDGLQMVLELLEYKPLGPVKNTHQCDLEHFRSAYRLENGDPIP